MRTLSIALLLSATAALGQIGNATWAAAVSRNFTEPAWWDQGVVFVGNWEPLIFRLRHGGANMPVDMVDSYNREHSEDTVLTLKRAGVNMIITNFYKMGIAAEREDIEAARRLAVLCHKHGMKIGTYIGGTMFAETLLRDLPEAKAWIRRDEHGDPIRYAAQTYRYRPDFNHPGYVEYMKKISRMAIEYIHTDLIHFDNHALIAPPWTGATPEINRRFREFLHRKYTPAQLKQRLGFSDISAVTVPSWQGISHPSEISPITDPVMQEWIDFRCQDFAEYYGTVADYIHKLDPNVVVELNPHGIYGTNRAFLNGVDHARLVPHGSVFWSEEPNEAQVDGQGNLISKIRSMKLARSLNQTLFSYTGTARSDPEKRSHRLLMAESMAFNRNSLGDVGDPLDVTKLDQDALTYIRFYHRHNAHFSSTRVVADVALLRSFPSLAYNSVEPQLETTLAEQLLIQYKIPFEYVFDQDLPNLSRYRAVILADQESLSDKAAEQLSNYVNHGGGILATGRTSLYNDWRRNRGDFALAATLGVHYLPGKLPAASRHEFGRGRAAYIPAIESVDHIPGLGPGKAPGQAGAGAFGNRYWKTPHNSDELLQALRWVVQGPFSVEFESAPLTTVMELTEKTGGRERVLHWLNYKLPTAVEPAYVTVSTLENGRVASIEVLSPDRPVAATIPFEQNRNRVRFQMPALEVYNMAVIRFAR